mmetsp:Transcript_34415/g.78457  ORF Transcript_34415/g.78457 Transcript_34415/m.78457 type:complete len:271 (-) Transcript_34415:221-1033(-)
MRIAPVGRVNNKAAAKAKQAKALSASGDSAGFNEEGYASVAATRNTQQMAVFIRRVIEGSGGQVFREADLRGFALYYSGARATQSYARLVEELSEKSREPDRWVSFGRPGDFSPSDASPTAHLALPSVPESEPLTEAECYLGLLTGTTATLDEDGYRGLVALKSTPEMKVFIRRVITELLEACVVDEAGLSGFAPYYSGVHGAQSFERLIEELRDKARAPRSWLRYGTIPVTPAARLAMAMAALQEAESEANQKQDSDGQRYGWNQGNFM